MFVRISRDEKSTTGTICLWAESAGRYRPLHLQFGAVGWTSVPAAAAPRAGPSARGLTWTTAAAASRTLSQGEVSTRATAQWILALSAASCRCEPASSAPSMPSGGSTSSVPALASPSAGRGCSSAPPPPPRCCRRCCRRWPRARSSAGEAGSGSRSSASSEQAAGEVRVE